MPYKDLEKERARQKRRRATPEVHAYNRKWYKHNPERMLRYRLKGKFGLTIERFQEMLRQQDGVCAICKEHDKINHRLSVDHNHVTGQVRGLLCTACNGMLGLAKDRPGTLRSGADYLEGRG